MKAWPVSGGCGGTTQRASSYTKEKKAGTKTHWEEQIHRHSLSGNAGRIACII